MGAKNSTLNNTIINNTLNKKYEIWVIVVLVLTIIVAHSVPILTNEFYIPWVDNKNENINNNIINDIMLKTRIDKKIYNIFDTNTLINDLNIDIDTETIKPERNSLRLGENFELFDSPTYITNISKHLNINNDHLIYIVKANPGHKIEEGRIQLMHNFNGSLKEAKSIWYMFLNIEWEFKNGWVFKNPNTDIKKEITMDTYYVPENNTIIEFKKDDTYEMLELKSDTPKYFVTIINF